MPSSYAHYQPHVRSAIMAWSAHARMPGPDHDFGYESSCHIMPRGRSHSGCPGLPCMRMHARMGTSVPVCYGRPGLPPCMRMHVRMRTVRVCHLGTRYGCHTCTRMLACARPCVLVCVVVVPGRVAATAWSCTACHPHHSSAPDTFGYVSHP